MIRDSSTLAQWVRHEGHSVSGAYSVRAALGVLTAHVPDAIILDWKLPDGSGLEVLQWLRSRDLHVPTALVTGFWADADFSAIDRDGQKSPLLLAMGPLLKGSLWETTAVPELRGQALRIAQRLVDELIPAEHRRVRAPVQTDVELLEYCI